MKGFRVFTSLFAAMVLSLAVGVGCSGDSGGSGGSDDAGGQTEDAANNMNADAGDNNTNDSTPDTSEEDTSENNTSGEVKTPCEQDNPPQRCQADPSEFDWAPASVVTELEISQDPLTINGEQQDSQIGKTIGDFGQLQTANSSIADNIADGTLILLLEHDRIEDLTNTGTSFDLNVWLGAFADIDGMPEQPGDPNAFNVHESSLDQGAQSRAYWAGAQYTSDNKITGASGAIPVKFNIEGAEIEGRIVNAAIESNVDTNKSALDGTGIYHTDAKLGGVLPLSDVHDSINNFVDSCSCVEGLDDRRLVEYEEGNPQEFTCAQEGADFNSDSCSSEGKENICATVASTCQAVSGILTPDKDLNGDGIDDALSVAIKYSSAGAEIVGVTDEQLGQ